MVVQWISGRGLLEVVRFPSMTAPMNDGDGVPVILRGLGAAKALLRAARDAHASDSISLGHIQELCAQQARAVHVDRCRWETATKLGGRAYPQETGRLGRRPASPRQSPCVGKRTTPTPSPLP